MARREETRVRLITRAGNNFASRFPFIVTAIANLPVQSCVIDGEAIVTDENGLAVFDLIRGHKPSATAVHCAFDLLELDGEDLRREAIETRKATLASLLRGAHSGVVLNRHFEGEGAIAASAARALCRSGSARRTSPVDRHIGSKSRIPPRQQ